MIYLTLVLILPSPASPTPCLPPSPPPRKEIFRDSLSRNLGPFPTFYVLGLIPGNTQGL